MSDSKRIPADRPWSDYPIGTKAHAYNGGCWTRVETGWRWGSRGDIFPTPGADAIGHCMELPESPTRSGLYQKYIVLRTPHCTPVSHPTFVLRVDGSDLPAMAALAAYALHPSCPPELSKDLLAHMERLEYNPAPPDLTEEEINQIYCQTFGLASEMLGPAPMKFARAILRAARLKTERDSEAPSKPA